MHAPFERLEQILRANQKVLLEEFNKLISDLDCPYTLDMPEILPQEESSLTGTIVRTIVISSNLDQMKEFYIHEVQDRFDPNSFTYRLTTRDSKTLKEMAGVNQIEDPDVSLYISTAANVIDSPIPLEGGLRIKALFERFCREFLS